MNKVGAAASGITGTLAVIGAAMVFIQPHEGTVNRTYIDPAGYVTVCSGNRSAAIPGAVFSDDECNLLLLADTIPHALAVRKLVTVPMTDDQWIALTSFSFNVGVAALRSSTLLRRMNAGDYDGAMDEFARWKHAGGRVLPGLVTRRAMEAAMFGRGNPG